jgi:hypothetical protein
MYFIRFQNFYCDYILARRPPVEETTSFLNSLLASHGPNYLEKLFGRKARNRLAQLGGVDNVAIALSGLMFPFNYLNDHWLAINLNDNLSITIIVRHNIKSIVVVIFRNMTVNFLVLNSYF